MILAKSSPPSNSPIRLWSKDRIHKSVHSTHVMELQLLPVLHAGMELANRMKPVHPQAVITWQQHQIAVNFTAQKIVINEMRF